MHRGALHPPLMVGAPYPLDRSDLEVLKEPGRSPTRQVEKLRNSHHNIARFASLGMKNGEIAKRTGYSYARIAQILQSPAMKDLVAHYAAALDAQFEVEAAAFYATGIENMVMAERMINDRLHEADEPEGQPLSVRELLAVSRDGADRFGYPKANTNVNVNTDFAAMLEKAIARSKVVEASPSPPSPEPASSPEPVPAPTRREL